MKIDIKQGDKFGKLTVLKEGVKYIQPSGQSQRGIICKCECGKETRVRLSHLVRGLISSCGCIQGERFGETGTGLHNSWRAMKTRCNSDNYIDYHRYKGRGITYCKEWDTYASFRAWALANGWREGLVLDRINNNGNYEPTNCRWVEPVVNANNTETTFMVKYKGEKIAFLPLLRKLGIDESHSGAIRGRIKRGWSHESAINTPIKRGNYKTRGVLNDHYKEKIKGFGNVKRTGNSIEETKVA